MDLIYQSYIKNTHHISGLSKYNFHKHININQFFQNRYSSHLDKYLFQIPAGILFLKSFHRSLIDVMAVTYDDYPVA